MKKDSGYYTFREKDLSTRQNELVILPPGFTIQHIDTADDLQKFHRGTDLVFNFPDNPDVYQILREAPSFIPELDLIVLSPDGEIAFPWFGLVRSNTQSGRVRASRHGTRIPQIGVRQRFDF